MNDILSFHGPNRWLSNFWSCDILYEGIIYPSTENAYQASKCHPFYRKKFASITPGESKRLARTLEIRQDWDIVKVPIMRELLKIKFRQGTYLHQKLIATGNCLIVEGNTWNDTFWGVCKGKGENTLGKLIMEIRDGN